MPRLEPELESLVKQWLNKAAQDLALAERVLQEREFRELVGFHCQQSVEKYVKAILVLRQVNFPKSHDIRKLVDLVQTVCPAIAEQLRNAEWLTPFGVEARYPSDTPEMLPGEEAEAVAAARDVKGIVTGWIHEYLSAS